MIKLENIHLSYKDKVLLENGKIEANRGEIVLIKGKSGCGKSTLLYELCLLGKVDFQYYWDLERIDQYRSSLKAKIRRDKIGYVMQSRILDTKLTVLENIQHYARINGIDLTENDVIDLLKKLHIEYLKDKDVSLISGGEWQRIAVTCAIAKKPELLLMDEPTSQLDDENEEALMKWVQTIAKEENICVVMTSHRNIEKYVDKVYEMSDKKLNLIKESTIEYSKCLDRKENKVHFIYSLYYSMRRNIKEYIKIFLMLAIIPLFMLLLNLGIDYYNHKQINIYEHSAQKEVYYHENDKQYVTINDEITARLLVYYPQNQINKYLQQDYKRSGCYISQSFIQYYRKDLRNSSLQISCDQNEISIDIGGLLYNNEFVSGLSEEEYYVFVSIDDYKTLTHTTPVFFVKSLDQLIKYPSSKIVFLEDIQICDQYIKTLNYRDMMFSFVNVVFVILSVLLSIFYCYYRRKEWTFRFVEGFSRLSLLLVSAIENLVLLLVVLLVVCLLSQAYSLLFVKYCAVLYGIMLIVSSIFVCRIDFVKMMRS